VNEGPWRVQVSGPAVRDIERLPQKYATAIVEMLSTLAENPKRLGKPLRFELEGRWSARRGPYRVIYTIDEDTQIATGLAVAHRADAYRRR
jgi:mRNA interferase RelE/StbE